MLHLNAQSRQYDGFTPGHRVFGRTPEIPIGTVGNPFRLDFTKPGGPSATQTHQAVAKTGGGFGNHLRKWDLMGNLN